jgi:hypothetical protein
MTIPPAVPSGDSDEFVARASLLGIAGTGKAISMPIDVTLLLLTHCKQTCLQLCNHELRHFFARRDFILQPYSSDGTFAKTAATLQFLQPE